MKLLPVMFVFVAFYFGCSKKDEGLIYGYLNSVEPYLDSTKLERFKYSENDSIIHRFSELYHNDRQIWDDSLQWVRLIPFFDTIDIVALEEKSLYYLCFALYDKTNGLPFNNAKILERCNPMILERKKARDENERRREKLYTEEGLTMKKNDKKVKIGEVVYLTFNAKMTAGLLEAYYDLAYFSSQELEVIKLSGILLKKDYHIRKIAERFDTLGIDYNLKIIKLNCKKFSFYESVYEEGDTLELALRAYNQPL